MNRFLEAGAVTKHERALITALQNGAADGAALLSDMRAFDLTMQDDRLRQVLVNIQSTVPLSQARAAIVNDALAAL